MDLITDTHSLLWFLTNHPSLSQNIRKIFDKTEKNEDRIVIPSIVLLELLYICEKRNTLEQFFRIIAKIKEKKNYIIQNLDLEIILECQKLMMISEMHDRVIVATAKMLNLPLITRDEEITHSGYIETIW